MSNWYILDKNDNPVLEMDFDRMIEWNKKNKTRVGNSLVGGKRISTVFLSLDHNHGEINKPLLWETMVFSADSKEEIYMKRYYSKKDAVAGHAKAVKMMREGRLC